MESSTGAKPSRWRRRAMIMSPSLLVLVGIFLYNWAVYHWQTPVLQTSSAVTPVVAIEAANPVGQAIVNASTAVPTAVLPTPTPTPLPSLPPDTAISLLGPPADAFYNRNDTITIYWHYPIWLPDGYQFVVYMRQNETAEPVGVISEPNLGSGYRVTASLPSLDTGVTALQWWVQVETSNPVSTILSSEIRTVNLIPNNN